MADELDIPNFSIEDTMDMGAGDTQLLKDLLSPETQTADVKDLEPIVKEAKPEPPKKEQPPKGKEIIPKEEGKDLSQQEVLKNFLGDAEEEEQEEPQPETPQTPVKEEEEDGEETEFTALSRDLFKLGVFSAEEDEEIPVITTPEQFLDRFREEKKKGAIELVNNFITQFGEDYQQAFEAIFVKGVNPRDYFGVYNSVLNFAELDMTKEENQISVVRAALTEQGFEPEDVNTEVDRLKNYGDLENVAGKHHKVMVKKEAAKLKQLEERSERELQLKNYIKSQYIQNVNGILSEKLKTKDFDGIPINPKLATELQDFLLVDKYKTASGETLTDFDRTILELKKPENHAMKVKIALLLKILEKDPTLSTIQRSAVSKQTDKLFGEVARQKTKGTTNPPPKRNSWFLE